MNQSFTIFQGENQIFTLRITRFISLDGLGGGISPFSRTCPVHPGGGGGAHFLFFVRLGQSEMVHLKCHTGGHFVLITLALDLAINPKRCYSCLTVYLLTR